MWYSMGTVLRRIRRQAVDRFVRYSPVAWNRDLPAETLQAIYDQQGWTGPEGAWRQRSVDRLCLRIHELYAVLGRPVRLLDVACFGGDYFGRLVQQGDIAARLSYTGIDVTPRYVAYARSRWREYANAQFVEGSALTLPYPNQSFDIVFNSGMLIHIDDPAACINEFARVASAYALVETTVAPYLARDFANKGYQRFLNRVYGLSYVRELLCRVGTIVDETTVPYKRNHSVLFELVPYSVRRDPPVA